MRTIRHFLAGVSVLAASGCAVISDLGANGLAENIENNAATLNDAHTRAMTTVIAMNVLRARDRWPTNYTTLSGIRSNPTLALGGRASLTPLGLGNSRLPFSGSSAEVSRNESANAEYSVNPFSNNDKTQSLLQPVQPQILESYWNAGWRKDILMWLFVDSITFAGSGASAFDGEQPWFVDGDEFGEDRKPEDIENLSRYREIMLQAEAGKVRFEKLAPDPQDVRNCDPLDLSWLLSMFGQRDETTAATVQAVESMTGRKVVFAPDNRSRASAETGLPADFRGRRVMLCDAAEVRWGFVDSATGRPLAAVRTRSFDDMIYFLGESMRNETAGVPNPIGGVILFRTYPDRGARQYAVRVEHAGEVHFIAPQSRSEGEPAALQDVTGSVLSLLNQLYLLAQSDEFLRAPEARLR
ncbi:hypothetical protein GC169_12890 [bacterium]|nr:hypothetical protein [bacterium]